MSSYPASSRRRWFQADRDLYRLRGTNISVRRDDDNVDYWWNVRRGYRHPEILQRCSTLSEAKQWALEYLDNDNNNGKDQSVQEH